MLFRSNLDVRLDALAPLLELRLEEFRTCRTQEATRATVEESLREATELGLRNTPSLFINARPLAGAQSYDAILHLIEYELYLQKQGSAPR